MRWDFRSESCFSGTVFLPTPKLQVFMCGSSWLELGEVSCFPLCVGLNLLKPTFNKGSTSPLEHYPAEVVEEKRYKYMRKVDLFSSLGMS